MKEIDLVDALITLAQGRTVEMRLDPKSLTVGELLMLATQQGAKFYADYVTKGEHDARKDC